MSRAKVLKSALRAAFPYTLPIMAAFLVLGMAYGILMRTAGLAVWYPILMSITIFAGSMQFVAVNLMTQPFSWVNALVLTLLVNARHIFYGLSLLKTYRGLGKKKLYLIFGLCDETFSLVSGIEPPEGVDRGWFYFFITLLDNSYWVIGSALGALFGELLVFDSRGIDFSMTALFLVMFLSQWEKEKNHVSSLCGLLVTALCLVIFGTEYFVVASMVGLLVMLTALRRPLEKKQAEEVQSS